VIWLRNEATIVKSVQE